MEQRQYSKFDKSQGHIRNYDNFCCTNTLEQDTVYGLSNYQMNDHGGSRGIPFLARDVEESSPKVDISRTDSWQTLQGNVDSCNSSINRSTMLLTDGRRNQLYEPSKCK